MRGKNVRRRLAVIAYVFMWLVSLALLIFMIVQAAARDTGSCSDIAEYGGSAANSSTLLPEPGLVLAFIGDQGLRRRSRKVLQLIRKENASMVFHLGDFDYLESPDRWIRQIFGELGGGVDYFAVAGNHDSEDLSLYARYSRRIRELLHPEAASCCCEGRVGVRAVCTYRGIAFLQIGHGLPSCSGDNGAEWVESELLRLEGRYPWVFCMFHVVQNKMQVEKKTNLQGWGVYEACRRHGAIVASAHAHVYARTHLMSRFRDPQEVVHTRRTLRVEPGRSFAFVSGLGGNSIRPPVEERLADPWWGAYLHRRSPLAGFGALFFHIGFRGDPLEALAYFKTTRGDIVDAFHVRVGS